MKDRVICISARWFQVSGSPGNTDKPVKGEIYIVIDVHEWEGKSYYKLEGLPSDCWWNTKEFRPVDSEFGPAICERVEDQINYEIAIEDEK